MQPLQREKLFTNHELLTLLWPLIIEQTLSVLVGMADTVMVSSVGEAAISGVSLVDMINQLIITDFDRADLNELGTFAHTQSGCFRIDHDVIRESSGQRVQTSGIATSMRCHSSHLCSFICDV